MKHTRPTPLILSLLFLTGPFGLGVRGGEAPPPFDYDGIEKYQDGRWSPAKAWNWYRDAGPIVGCNYLPRTAVNMTEMWQAETFNPEVVDQELEWASKAGYNSIRVFIQYLVWKEDPAGLRKRLGEFLAIADQHQMRVMLVPFCDCAFSGREPYLGKQDDPTPGVANGRWVPSPGLKRVVDREAWPALEKYIKDLVGSFGRDRRVLIWDLYNEPGQAGLGEQSMPLVAAAFRWAREMKPEQPLTAGVWTHYQNRMSLAQFELSDVISFHSYLKPDELVKQIEICKQFKRPVICTEWLMRQHGNTFETILPIFAKHQIGSYHWGLVAGRTQTYLHWESKPGDPMPKVWQHDMFGADGTLHDPQEIPLLHQYRGELQQQLQAGTTASAAPHQTQYRGWNCYELKNKFVRLHVVPDIGGRVIQYALGDKEFFWVNPVLEGKSSPETGLDPDDEWLNYGGDKLWPAPQGWDNDEQWPGPPGAVLDGQPHRAEVELAPAGIRLTSRDDSSTGIRFSRRLQLHPRSTHVSVEATMTNIDDKPRRWGIWAHTQLDASLPDSKECNRLMRAWCPINPDSHFERGYNVIFGEKDNPAFETDPTRSLMKVSYHYNVSKIGLDSHGGWVATVDGRKGDVFVQRFVYEPDKDYPDGSSVEFWHNGAGRIHAYNKWIEMPADPASNPYIFESEVLSPYASLKPGEHYTWSYDWYACRIGGDFPVLECTPTGVVSERLSLRKTGNRTQLLGRFGVFHQGSLVLEAYDGKNALLMSEVLRPYANPLEPIVLEHTVTIPATTRSLSIALMTPAGVGIGEVTRLSISEN